MPKPATFIALPMPINPIKWYLVYMVMLIYFKIVILSVTFLQSVTVHKYLIFRRLRQKVILIKTVPPFDRISSNGGTRFWFYLQG